MFVNFVESRGGKATQPEVEIESTMKRKSIFRDTKALPRVTLSRKLEFIDRRRGSSAKKEISKRKKRFPCLKNKFPRF